jgi:hypothetical protein
MTPSTASPLVDASFLTRFLNFDEFITSRLLKIVYVIGAGLILLITVGGGGLTALGSLFVALSTASLGGVVVALFFFVLSLVGGALGVLLWRVYCELIMVIFKINENLQTLREQNALRWKEGLTGE